MRVEIGETRVAGDLTALVESLALADAASGEGAQVLDVVGLRKEAGRSKSIGAQLGNELTMAGHSDAAAAE